MELSVLPRPQLETAPSDERCRLAPADLKLFDVPIPEELRHFGESVRASALGDPANPPVVVLGGISANCFPALQPDGSPGWWSGLAGEGQVRRVAGKEEAAMPVAFQAQRIGAVDRDPQR